MKKLLLLLLIFALVGASAFAIDFMSFPSSISPGSILIDAGLGLRSKGYSDASWNIPPLFVHADYALPVRVPITVGAMFTICQYGYDYKVGGSKYSWKWTDMTFAARGNWHVDLDIDWLDLYAGLSLGYIYCNWDSDGWTGPKHEYGGFFLAGQIGAHFYFTKMIGAVAEFGYPYWVKVGVAIKF